MHAMLPTPDHPHVIWYEWQIFKKEFSPYLIEQVLDRRDTDLPKWYAPIARGAAIPSSYLLSRAGYRPGSYRARGWRKPNHEEVWKEFGADCLVVRREQRLWRIELNGLALGRPHDHSGKTLVHNFGSTPIVTRSYQSATHLAEFCLLNGPPSGLRWNDECPDDMKGAIEFYRIRQIVEATMPSTRTPRGK